MLTLKINRNIKVNLKTEKVVSRKLIEIGNDETREC